MSKRLRVAVAGAVLVIAVSGSGPAWADPTTRGNKSAGPCSPSGTSLALTAQQHKFDKDCLAVTAGESFTIWFDNRDRDRHNVAILPGHTSTETIFAGDIVPGPKSTVYAVPSMKAGTYHFHCEVHPNLMNGMFVVAAPPAAAGQPASTPPTTTMDDKKAGAAPTTVAAAAPKSPATTATTRGAAAVESAAAGTNLPRTGAADRLLVLLAGLALIAGGLSVLGGARAKA